MNLMQMLFSNPQKIIMQIMGKNNPMAANLLNMIANKDEKGIEQLARNLAKEKGKDPDALFNEYKNMFGA